MSEQFWEIHYVCNLIMVGVIWVIQLVHYPSFKFISDNSFKDFNHFHQKSISLIVAPVMLIELASIIGIFIENVMQKQLGIAAIILGINLLIWLITFFYFIPLHKKLLEQDKDQQILDDLVKYNWPRTMLWTLKVLIIAIYL